MASVHATSTFGVILALLTACAGSINPESLQAWVGRPADALEREWGPATREVRDGDQRILVYEEVRRSTSRSLQTPPPESLGAYGAANADAGPLTVSVRSYIFWVSPEGVVVRSDVREP